MDPSWIAQNTEIIDLTQATPLPGNPHRGDIVALARSLARFGQRYPLVLRRTTGDSGEIEAGNHRLQAAQLLHQHAQAVTSATGTKRDKAIDKIRQQLGTAATDALLETIDQHGPDTWSKIAVTWIDEEPEEALAFAATDNHTATLGHDDPALLAQLTARIAQADRDLLALFTTPTPGPATTEPTISETTTNAPANNAPTTPNPHDPHEATNLRTLTFTLPLADWAWTTAHLHNIRRDHDLPDLNTTLLHLLHTATGHRPPGLPEQLDEP